MKKRPKPVKSKAFDATRDDAVKHLTGTRSHVEFLLF